MRNRREVRMEICNCNQSLMLIKQKTVLKTRVKELEIQVRNLKACAEIAVTAGKMLADEGNDV